MEVCKIFTNVNIDLMYGLPGQNQIKVRKDIDTLKTFNVAHISYYQLTIEPGTMFYSNVPKLPSEDVIWDMYSLIMNELARNGYSRYEVSAYSKGWNALSAQYELLGIRRLHRNRGGCTL